jgi:DNA polymerase-3 subunit delta
MLDHKAAKADIAREVGINPYFLDDMIAQAKNFGRGKLRGIFDELYRCDLASKTGGGQPYTLMHGLVVGICTIP